VQKVEGDSTHFQPVVSYRLENANWSLGYGVRINLLETNA